MSRPFPERGRGDRGPVRHDLEPLLKRFSALGEPEEAAWQGGILESSVDIGLRVYWIEAVVKLAPGTAGEIAQRYGPTASEAPVVPEELESALTDGPWLSGGELWRAAKGGGFGGEAFLDVDDDVLVMLVVGGSN